ncbi:hypothetical protein [Bradyrhizobium sp. CCGUVB23]|uniref:hypothetical protein n=1 Tax=Bradyrhizobium sp. CCGUVB23 TaxID=2949630 RepID=UPI0020B29C1A|nr:hypothetical protein [Bradyrhizobium sp. CCGUVB23]MCP3462909.1 hypothetical protein [Bradyrhizobium sp. CCGUVB23]
MSRLSVPHLESATATTEIHIQIKRAFGSVPNTAAAIRDREPAGHAERDALVRFIHSMARTSRTTRDEDDFATIGATGYTDVELIDISLASNISGGSPRMVSCSHWGTIEIPFTPPFSKSVRIFTDVFNGINDTEIDFPAVA